MSKVVKTVLKVAAVVAAVFIPGVGTLIGKALLTAAVSIGVSKLVAKRANTRADAGADAGGRVQLAPATDNKLPIVYGSAFVGGAITDAVLSTDQKTMWYVVSLADVTVGSTYTYDTTKFYYDGKNVQFGTNGAVTGLTTNTSVPQTDTRCNGFLYIYLFTNGSNSGVNTGGLTAQQIISTANGAPASKAWTANHQMSYCAFAIVKVIYNTDAGMTGVGALTAHITNSLTKPGEVIEDYMRDSWAGGAIPVSAIDLTSLADLDTYSDQLIDYKPVGWNPGDPYSQQARYRINGVIDTGRNVLDNLQFMVDTCDSWLQYSELTGKWRVVMNKKYTGSPVTSGLFLVDSSNIVGGITISPIDLNETYNQIEVAYPNANIKDQTDYQIIDLYTQDPQLLSVNEAQNRLNVTLPLVNNAVQARYLAQRRIYQSREDLVIECKIDYSGIQIEAGDVIRVTHEVYGWTEKLFRVSSVVEEKDTEGNLFVVLQAFEYNDQIYDDIVDDYVPAFNTGLEDPNVIDQPLAPVFVNYDAYDALVTGFVVGGTVPEKGQIMYMDFNYGSTSNVNEHVRYTTINQSNSEPYLNSDYANANFNIVLCPVNDLAAGSYYWSVTARNDFAGKTSNSSNIIVWDGANIQPFDPINNVGGIIGNQIQANTITGNNIQANTITGGKIQANTITGNLIQANTITGNNIQANTITGTNITVDTITANNIVANTITGNKIAGNTITLDNLGNNLSVTQFTTGYYYECGNPVANTITVPVDITSIGSNLITGNWAVPKYITNVYPGFSSNYPFYVGDAAQAEGYLDDSSGPLAPGTACVFNITNGDFEWWVLENAQFAISSGTAYFIVDSQFASDIDATIQITPYVSFGNNVITTNTQSMVTIDLIANSPYNWQANLALTPAGSITQGGLIIRNLTANANITSVTAFFRINKGK